MNGSLGQAMSCRTWALHIDEREIIIIDEYQQLGLKYDSIHISIIWSSHSESQYSRILLIEVIKASLYFFFDV